MALTGFTIMQPSVQVDTIIKGNIINQLSTHILGDLKKFLVSHSPSLATKHFDFYEKIMDFYHDVISGICLYTSSKSRLEVFAHGAPLFRSECQKPQ
jgi:hypothetical protein